MIDITNSCKIDILNTTEPLNFHEVFAFDIESDGLVGNLSVSGVIIFSNDSVTAICLSTTTTSQLLQIQQVNEY